MRPAYRQRSRPPRRIKFKDVTADQVVPRFIALPQTLNDPWLDLQEFLVGVHGRIRRIDPAIGRISFVIHDPASDQLRTYLCHDLAEPERRFDERTLASLPALISLQAQREARVIDDLATELDPTQEHNRWLLAQGWRSCLTVPLLRRNVLLGFLFLDASRPAAFDRPALEILQPHLDLLMLRIGDDLGSLADLNATLGLVVEIAALRDPQTGHHLQRVSHYCRLVAQELAEEVPLPADFAALMFRFAALHDVGKMGIPDQILLKPREHDPAERQVMRTHVAIGIALIERLIEALHLVEDPSTQLLRQVVAHHHEYLDGSGYPAGLRGEAVSLAGRIVAVADIYDSLTQARPYKAAFSEHHAEQILRSMVGAGKLDGRCVEALLRAKERRAAIQALPTALLGKA
jgi:HD-GYP domain-containing protein (c-di-GMP phosphodiesterase class II)